MNQYMNILNLLNSNPDRLFDTMMQGNPQFRKFVEDNKWKTPEQIAQENGININMIRNLFR